MYYLSYFSHIQSEIPTSPADFPRLLQTDADFTAI